MVGLMVSCRPRESCFSSTVHSQRPRLTHFLCRSIQVNHSCCSGCSEKQQMYKLSCAGYDTTLTKSLTSDTDIYLYVTAAWYDFINLEATRQICSTVLHSRLAVDRTAVRSVSCPAYLSPDVSLARWHPGSETERLTDWQRAAVGNTNTPRLFWVHESLPSGVQLDSR